MTRIRVFVVLLLALSGVLCDNSQRKDKKHEEKSLEWKKTEKKTEKRDSSELTAVYTVKSKDDSFRPVYQYHYQGAPFRPSSTPYVTAATTPQLSYSKPDAIIGIGGRTLSPTVGGGTITESSTTTSVNNGGIQYAPPGSYKAEGGIQYAPNSYKSTSTNSLDGVQYASSVYRGPFVPSYQPVSTGQVKVHPVQMYAPPPSSAHPPASVTLPLHFGGFDQQQLPHQQHQQNQYAIAFPAEYVRHYQQNLAAPFPLQGAHMVPLVYTAAPAPPASAKDQSFKQSAAVHFISLAQQPSSPMSATSSSQASGPSVYAHFIPYYGMGTQQHQQFQQQSSVPFYFGGHHQQSPTAFAYAQLPQQQQIIQISPKHQIMGQIQMATIGAAGAAATIPIPLKHIIAGQQQHQQQQQLLQPLHHFHQHYNPGATSYTRYSQGLSGASGNGGAAGNSIEIPASESSSALKLGSLYSTSPSQNSGNNYSGATGSGSGKMSYTYASDVNSVGPVYSHPAAIHYGTHLYHPPTKVVEIGSNKVTAGSAAIAGEAPPAYHSHQQSAAGNSHNSGGGSSSIVKFH